MVEGAKSTTSESSNDKFNWKARQASFQQPMDVFITRSFPSNDNNDDDDDDYPQLFDHPFEITGAE